jgi:AcrR family transcriptional regulator
MSRPPESAGETLDGRRRRGQDNRARIVAAMMEIVHGGDVAPSAEQVATRADVGLRTVFRHFQDMDSLYREIAAVVGVEARALLAEPIRAETWRERILAQAERRGRVFEIIAPYKRAADVFRHRSKFLGSDYSQMVAELRERLERELPDEIVGDPLKLEALDLLMSFETWSRLRTDQALSVEAAQAVIAAAVARTLG